jgi:hypothetical protein
MDTPSALPKRGNELGTWDEVFHLRPHFHLFARLRSKRFRKRYKGSRADRAYGMGALREVEDKPLVRLSFRHDEKRVYCRPLEHYKMYRFISRRPEAACRYPRRRVKEKYIAPGEPNQQMERTRSARVKNPDGAVMHRRE